MGTILISLIFCILLLTLTGFLVITHKVNKEMKDKGEVDPSKLTFFHETYHENRKQFRQLATGLRKQFKKVEISKLIVKSMTDSDLSIDTIYIPAQNEAKKLIIMSSGVHGIEGFVGSAVQRHFMSEMLDGRLLQNMGVLLIHAINPYGFKYGKRVSENNVDMNRNFDIDKDLFTNKNEGYRKLDPFLNPQKEAKTGYFRNGSFFLRSVYLIRRFGMEPFRQSIVRGQFEFPNGIFYGGNNSEPQKEWLDQLILEKSEDYEFVFAIDIHTGYGERGKLHFIPIEVQGSRRTLLEKMFKDYEIDWPNPDENINVVRGDFRDYVGRLIPADKKYIGVAFEFGTLNSLSIIGSIRSLQNMILENQGCHHGYRNRKAELIIKERFREMFFPSSRIWRSQIMELSSKKLQVLIDRYAELD